MIAWKVVSFHGVRSVPSGVTLGYAANVNAPGDGYYSMIFPKPVTFDGGGLSDLTITRVVVRGADRPEGTQVTEVGIFGAGIDGFQIVDLTTSSTPFSPPPVFLRGDTTASGVVDMTDAIVTLEVVLLGQGTISCLDAADANDDGLPDMTEPLSRSRKSFSDARISPHQVPTLAASTPPQIPSVASPTTRVPEKWGAPPHPT